MNTPVSLDRQQAIQYLRATVGGPWHWAENGDALVWHDGTTIAFKAEIAKILEHLAPALSNGLPPFSALVLLLAAARGKLPPAPELNPPSSVDGAGRAAILGGLGFRVRGLFNDAVEQLRRVADLPADLRSGLKGRCLLAEAAFEKTSGERHVDAGQILRGMAGPFSDEELAFKGPGAPRDTLVRDVELVANGLKPHTVESLTLRLRTGLDSLPDESGIGLPPAEQARRLIEELSRDAELGPIARAARDLLAVVRLPRRLLQADELPLGGVSDITNRGPLDRLLLSELAHDDLTLSVRVALNEALYLRREPPRREPPGTLAILLDSGVRLWGMPRVLATAAAMALIAQDRHGARILAWRADRFGIREVDLLTREGLARHLESLATEAHPGGCLPVFAKTLPDDGCSQSVVVTHSDTFDDPEFREALSAHAGAIGFVATVTREGRFELHAMPLARRPPVCQADLDMDAVFSAPAGGPPVRRNVDPNLPAVFGVSPFPFLLPLTGRLECSHSSEDGVVHGVMLERRLVEFTKPNIGGRILAVDIPAGSTQWMETVDGVVYFVKASTTHRPVRLCSFALPEGPIRALDLPELTHVEAGCRYGDVLILAGQGRVVAYSLRTGQVLHRRLNPHELHGGRFLKGTRHFYAIVWDGTEILFEEIPFPDRVPFENILCVFDRKGFEGPWYVTRDGIACSTAGDDVVRFNPPDSTSGFFGSARASSNGHTAWLTRVSDARCYRWDLKSNTSSQYYLVNRWKKWKDPQASLPTRTCMRAFNAIALLDNGVALRGKNDTWRRLVFKDGRMCFEVFEPLKANRPMMRHSFPIPVMERNNRSAYTLYPVEWPDGSRAWLDSRGLLHLRSSDLGVPELSFVLADKRVAAWSSAGHRCGPQFFFGQPDLNDDEIIADALRRFVETIG